MKVDLLKKKTGQVEVVQQYQNKSKPVTQLQAAINASSRMVHANQVIKSVHDAQDKKIVQRVPKTIINPATLADGLHYDTNSTDTVKGETVPKKVIAYMRNTPYGSRPSVNPPGWDWLQKKLGRLKGKWVRFHLINDNLGGSGSNTFNLIPTTVAANNTMCRDIETDAKESANAVNPLHSEWTYIEVNLDYDKVKAPAPIPYRIRASWGKWDDSTGAWAEEVSRNITNGDLAAIDSQTVAYLRGTEITMRELESRHVPRSLRSDFLAWLKDYSQDDDDEQELAEAAEANDDFGSNFEIDWLDGMWLDEDDNGKYQVVVKALGSQKRKR